MNIVSRQKDLERQAIDEGRGEHHALNERLRMGSPEMQLIKRLMIPLTKAIIDETKRCSEKYRGRPKKYCEPLQSLSPQKLSLITIHEVLNSCNDPESTFTKSAMNIANIIEKELYIEKLSTKSPKALKATIRYLQYHDPNEIDKDRLELKEEFPDWDKKIKGHIGSVLIHLLMDSTAAFNCDNSRDLGIKTVSRIKMSETTIQYIQKKRLAFEKLAPPIYKPMLCEPKPWRSLEEGGYLLIKNSLVRRLGNDQRKLLEGNNLSDVYHALNLIQATPWRINKSVFNVMKECIKRHINLVTLKEENLRLPEKPKDFKTSNAAKAKWLQRKREIKALISESEQVANIVAIASNYINETKLFYPHYIDWRGRAYPFPKSLNPQGGDSAKGLLEFADGRALGESGAFWLAVHLANLFGMDKCSFEERKTSFKERQTWVIENEDKIIDSVEKPLQGEQFWMTAEKPWSALAACFEWYGYIKKKREWVSHIPIAMDGTCNGLQHYSALGRDAIGGYATNLMDSEYPQDIYTEVLKVIKNLLDQDVKKNKQEAKNWKDHIERRTVKRGVMTTPYGVQEYGLREQLVALLKEMKRKGENVPRGSFGKNAFYLSKLLIKAIGEVVKSAPQYMKWFQEIAELLARSNIPIVWTTPLGFTVIQNYKPRKKTIVRTARQRLTLRIEDPKSRLSVRRNVQGLPPNFIHSLDSVHMMMTVIAASEKYDISSFAVVHDSYAVHACECDNFSYLIREKFVELHSKDILKEFKDNLQHFAPDVELPSTPMQGDLDINDVLNSKYFFS